MSVNVGYDLVIIIVNKGWSEHAVNAAQEAGAGGATVFNGRGTGKSSGIAHLFGLAIEPEKEIVFSVVNEAVSGQVVEAVEKALDLRAPGTGIAMVLPLKCVTGLFNANSTCKK